MSKFNHRIIAMRRLRQELKQELPASTFEQIEMTLIMITDIENMQLQRAWKFGKEGKTFADFMDSFPEKTPYTLWPEDKL